MTDELNRLIDAASQPPTGGFDEVDRLVRRRQRRRTAGVAIGAVAVLAGGAVLAANGIDGDDPTTVAKDPVAHASTPTNGPGASTFPASAPVGGDRPPPLRIATADGVIKAQQGSYCWGGQCADYAVPQWSDLPQVGEISPLLAAFGLSGRLDVTTVSRDDERCRYYPALVETDGDDLTITPSGPAGEVMAQFFVSIASGDGGGDTSALWRWRIPERTEDLAWLALRQNTPSSGGEARISVVLDSGSTDHALGKQPGKVTVTAANGARTQIDLDRVDQHCPDDGVLEVATPYNVSQKLIDGLGPAPYSYDVELYVDGRTRHLTGTSSGQDAPGGSDTRLTEQ